MIDLMHKLRYKKMICNVKRRIREKEAAFEVAKSDFYKAQNQLSDKESKIKDLQSALERKTLQ
jgi:hypothetical protein